MNTHRMNDAEAHELARLMDPKAAVLIEACTHRPCADNHHYAQSCLSGFADRALDAKEAL